jgi:4-hydroxy-tetrahydrodipicolinate reductase
MNILIIGYGKMGKKIEEIAQQRGHNIAGKIDKENQGQLSHFTGDSAQVAIEFSQPDAAVDNIRYCLNNGIPIVSGTTGWLNHKQEIESICKQNEGTFFYASNYSIGVNLFFRLNSYLADLMAPYQDYGVHIEEIHHTEKKDAPSGTAITLAEKILEVIPAKTRWVNQESLDIGDLVIRSLREPDVPGTHTIRYQSEIDDIEIKHTAHSRTGFALGAVMAAEWVHNKKGLFGMDDFLGK